MFQKVSGKAKTQITWQITESCLEPDVLAGVEGRAELLLRPFVEPGQPLRGWIHKVSLNMKRLIVKVVLNLEKLRYQESVRGADDVATEKGKARQSPVGGFGEELEDGAVGHAGGPLHVGLGGSDFGLEKKLNYDPFQEKGE